MGIVGSVWAFSIIALLLGGGILQFATWHWLFTDKYTDCDHCHYISYMDISFSRGRNSRQIKN